MAKTGKLTKLKSAIKRFPSFTKQLTRSASSIVSSSADDNHPNINISKNLHAVYVGKSLRRYLVSSEIISHPLFQELVERSSSSNSIDIDDGVVVACEVVLFEHLLWMLENSDDTHQLESTDELVEFYTCAC